MGLNYTSEKEGYAFLRSMTFATHKITKTKAISLFRL